MILLRKRNSKTIYKVDGYREIGRGMHVIECPVCGNVCASASERGLLPEWTICEICEMKEREEKKDAGVC